MYGLTSAEKDVADALYAYRQPSDRYFAYAVDKLKFQMEKPMTLHASTFEYLKPTDEQIAQMRVVREAAAQYAKVLESQLPDGPDKTFALRQHRETAMWCNVAITRHPDGTPRT